MQDLADEEADAAHLAEDIDEPDEARLPEWAEWYVEAWQALRFDRQYGALGGETGISFVAVDAFARSRGVEGVARVDLERFVRALDGVWLDYVAEQTARPQDQI